MMPPAERQEIRKRGAAPTAAYGSIGASSLPLLASQITSTQSIKDVSHFLQALRAELGSTYTPRGAAPTAAAAAAEGSSSCCCCWWLQTPVTGESGSSTTSNITDAVTVGSWALQQLLKKLSKHKGEVQVQDAVLLAALLCSVPQRLNAQDLPVVLDVAFRLLQQLQPQQQQAQQEQSSCCSCCMGCCCCCLRQLLGVTSAAAEFTGAPSLPCVEAAIRLAASAANALLTGAARSSEQPGCCCSHQGRSTTDSCRFILLQALCACSFRLLSRLLTTLPDSSQRHVTALMCAAPLQRQQQQKRQEKQRHLEQQKGLPSPLELLLSVLGLVGLLRRRSSAVASCPIQQQQNCGNSNGSTSSSSGMACAAGLQKETMEVLRRMLGPSLNASLAADLQQQQQQNSDALDAVSAAAEARERNNLQQLECKETRREPQQEQQKQQEEQRLRLLLAPQKGDRGAHRILFAALAAIGQEQRFAFLTLAHGGPQGIARDVSQVAGGPPQSAPSAMLAGLGLLEALPQLAGLLLNGLSAVTTDLPGTATAGDAEGAAAAAAKAEAAGGHLTALDGFLLLLQIAEPLLALPVTAFSGASDDHPNRQQRTQQQQQQQLQQLLSIECMRWDAVVTAWHRVCGSSLLSPRLLEQRRHQAALSAFACRCLAALHAVLQQLRMSLRLPLTAITPVVDVFKCIYTAASPLAAPAVQMVCALLRTLWGGVSLQLQLMPRGLEGLLQVVFQLQELQHTLLHAAVSTEPQEALGACLATRLPPEDDVMRRSGSAEFLQLLGCTYTRMNDIPTLLASLGEHLGVTAMTSSSSLTLQKPAASESSKAVLAMQQKLGAFARAARAPRGSLAFGLRRHFLEVISTAASAALASQVPVLLQRLQQMLLQSTAGLLHAAQQQQQQQSGLATLVVNAVAIQLMMAAFLRGVQRQPQQQQELLLLHLLEALPEATAPITDFQSLHQQLHRSLSGAAEDGEAARQPEQHPALLLNLLRRGRDTLRLTVCMLLRHVRSFATPFAVVERLLPALAVTEEQVALPLHADAAELSAALRSVAQSTRALKKMQQQQQPAPTASSDETDAEDAQQKALLLLHHQQQALQLQQSRALQRLEYLLLVNLLQEDGAEVGASSRQQSRKRLQRQVQPVPVSKGNCNDASAPSVCIRAAVLLLLLQQEMRSQLSRKGIAGLVLSQLHRFCHCRKAGSDAAAEGRWLVPHLPLLFRLLVPIEGAASDAHGGCAECGKSLASCVLSSAAELCLVDPLPAAHAAAATATGASATLAAVAAVEAATEKAQGVVVHWELSPGLLEERAAYPLLMHRLAALLAGAAAAVEAPDAAAAATGALREASAPKKQRIVGYRKQPEFNGAEAAATANGQIAALVALHQMSRGLCAQLPREVFACSSPDDSAPVAVALWEAFQATTQVLREVSLSPAQRQVCFAAAAALCRALARVCASGSAEPAERWAAACIPKGRYLCATLVTLTQCPQAAGSTDDTSSSSTADTAVAVAEALADVLWAASLPAASAGRGAAAAVAAVADLLLRGGLAESEDGGSQRQQLHKQIKAALRAHDVVALMNCCSAAAGEFADRVAQAVLSTEADGALQGVLLLPLAAFKALHALVLPWARHRLLQQGGQVQSDQQQQPRQQQKLLQGLEEALPSDGTRGLIARIAVAVATALDERLTACTLLGSPAASAANGSLTLAHFVACIADLLRQHQLMGAWLLHYQAEALGEEETKESVVTERGDEVTEKQQQQRDRVQLQRHVIDRISALIVSRCSSRTFQPFLLQEPTSPTKRPKQLLRFLGRLQGVLLSEGPEEEGIAGAVAAEGRVRLRRSCMRFLLLLCSHWSGAMKQFANMPSLQQQQGHEDQRQEKEKAVPKEVQLKQLAADQDLCKCLTAKLTGLLLQLTKRVLRMHVGAAADGVLAAAAAARPQQKHLQQQHRAETSPYQGQYSVELQHLLAVVLHQEQQKDSLEVAATYFTVDMCWGSFALGLPAALLTHAVAHLVSSLTESLGALSRQPAQQEQQEQQERREPDDAVLTAAACAQALWNVALQRSELIRCLRREDAQSPLLQTLLAASQLLLQLLQAAKASTDTPCCSHGKRHQQSHEQQKLQRQTEGPQTSLSQMACTYAWCCSRTSQFLGELFRCCALAAAGRKADRLNKKSQGAPDRRQLEAVADAMMDFARGLLYQTEVSVTLQQQQQLPEGPLTCLSGRAALRSCSVLLTALWRSHEFIPLQRQQQMLLILVLRLLRLLPRLQHRQMLEDGVDALRRIGGCMANRSSSSKRLLLFFAGEVAHLRQQQLQGAAVAAAPREGDPITAGERRRLLGSNLLSLVFEEMAGAAAADEGGEIVGEVACHFNEPSRSALQNAFDEFCQHHLYKGNA